MSLLVLPRQLVVDGDGTPRSGAKLKVYAPGSVTPITTYTTSDYTVAHQVAGPTTGIASMATGLFPAVYVNPAVNPTYKIVITDANDVVLDTQDNIPTGAAIYPRTAAEEATGVAIVDYTRPSSPIDVLRYGIVPNDITAATSNTTILRALLAPNVEDGPTGELCFYPVEGGDTYHFNGLVDVRPGITWRVFNTRTLCTYTLDNDDAGRAFTNFLRDGGFKGPGVVEFNGNTTGGDSVGSIFMFGSRHGRPYGQWPSGVFDKDNLIDEGYEPMGNLYAENITFRSNNPAVAMAHAFGGLRGWGYKGTVVFDGMGLAPGGPLYEYGWASKNGSNDDEDWTSSHATGTVWEDVIAGNFSGESGWSAGELTGVWDARITNFTGKDCDYSFSFRPGEALYFRPWTPDGISSKRCLHLGGNIRSYGCENGVQLKGAESAAAGYLSGEGLTEAQQTDLMKFSLDGFELVGGGTGTGLFVSGPCDVRNGSATGFFNNLVIGDECVQFAFTNCDFVDSEDVGVRGNFGDKIFGTARKKIGKIEECFIAGSTGAGISFGNTQAVRISNNRFGHSPAHNGRTENDQTYSVALTATANGVVCDSNHSTIKSGGGGVSYDSAGTSDRGNNIVNPQGDTTFTAAVWQIDGVGRATDTALADITHAVNTVGKYTGKKYWDTSNTTLRLASGPTAGATWEGADGSGDVTPV